jgi:hypothetical protein
VLIAHLSDLHLRDHDDVVALGNQLDRIVARQAVHLAITGDLLDRWDPALLARVLDALASRGFLDADRLTLLHGNHDLASSGGHPRRSVDLWRLALRFWDPPPLATARKKMFYAAVEKRAGGVASIAPFTKALSCGWRVAVIDTVPFPWWPLSVGRDAITVRHAVGSVREPELDWLVRLQRDRPLMLLIHHYPLDVAPYHWRPDGVLGRFVQEVRVPMALPSHERKRFWDAASAAGVRLVLCGHVHRTRLDRTAGVAVGLNGQSGADWAGRTIAYYDLSRPTLEQIQE